jgi:hypothetical protein
MPRPVNWQTDFCLPLAGYGSTTITSADPNLNRPALPALCEWVRQGWSGLDSGLGIYAGAVPEARLLDRPVGLDAREFFSSWAPRTPFAGPSDWEWAVGTTPWLGGVFGLDPPPVGNDPGVAAFELLAAEGTYWVRLDDQEVYILVREPDGREAPRLPHPPFSDVHPPRLGFSPIDAAAIGIAWKMMREALANLQPWWTAIVNSGAGTPDVPFGAGVPDVLAGGQSVVSRLVARAQGLAPEYPRIFLWEDPHWNVAAASSQGRSRSIRFRAGVAKGISAPLHRLAATGLTNWALYEYPQLRFPPYPKVSAGGIKDAADHLARLAGILTHELMHDLWRNELDYWQGWHTDNYPWCWGPKMSVTPTGPLPPLSASPLRQYRFASAEVAYSQTPDVRCREIPTAFRDPSGLVNPLDRASRHYAHFVVQAVVRGILLNNPGGEFRDQDLRWCRDCSAYAAFYQCGANVPVLQYPFARDPTGFEPAQ